MFSHRNGVWGLITLNPVHLCLDIYAIHNTNIIMEGVLYDVVDDEGVNVVYVAFKNATDQLEVLIFPGIRVLWTKMDLEKVLLKERLSIIVRRTRDAFLSSFCAFNVVETL
ncbi:unnamed protein product [Vicia faba]|uniref:Uncharacterized protein n=1 Tax=Vicia faba TaxID=3906 RepID=A0AAV1A7P2_VICFA|nr:unnamed protein product [Vicia faba]